MRSAPKDEKGQVLVPPPIVIKDRPDIITQVREYELITPLFGGGVEPGQYDDLTPIRATEIRGHLRFWWRATRGGRYGDDLNAMRKDEGLIWGAASTARNPRPAQVQIVVEKRAAGQPIKYRDLDSDLQYAAFPLQEGNKPVQEGVKFALRISFPQKIEFLDEDNRVQIFANVRAEVEAALWAWETFGGVGARTRRGFGALRCTHKDGDEFSFASAANTPVEVRTVIDDDLYEHLVEGKWPKDVPHLSADIFFYRITLIKTNRKDAWKKVIAELKIFRQHRPGFGRSRWPEPDAIRNLTKQWLKPGSKGSTHPGHLPHPNNSGKFPRAVFGLPIVFHFKDNDEDHPSNADHDPRDVVLKLDSHDRLASPIILRPLCLSEGRYVGLAVLLEGTLQPEDFYSNDIDLILTEKDGKRKIADGLKAELSLTEAKSIKEVVTNNPLLGKKTDPLIAFLNRIQKEDD
jgi:CRISPR-associated protein Cmr1